MPLRGSYKFTTHKSMDGKKILHMIKNPLFDIEMKHLNEALEEMNEQDDVHIKVEGNKVIFWIQDGPVRVPGSTNGLQAVDILRYVQHLFESLNKAFPCRENALTITKIEEAIHWQDARTADREKRNVEGKSEA